jgi:hypothetical protein
MLNRVSGMEGNRYQKQLLDFLPVGGGGRRRRIEDLNDN